MLLVIDYNRIADDFLVSACVSVRSLNRIQSSINARGKLFPVSVFMRQLIRGIPLSTKEKNLKH